MPTGEAAKLIEQAEDLLYTSPSDALSSASKALDLCRKAKDVEGTSLAVKLVVSAYLKLDDDGKALQAATEELEATEKSKDKTAQAEAQLRLSEVYSYKGDYENALKYATKAVDSAKYAGAKKVEGAALLGMTTAHLLKNNTNVAVTRANDALAIFQEVGDKKLEAGAYHNLASAKVAAGATDEALDAGEVALQMYRSLDDKKGEAFTLHTIAKAFLNKESQASEAFREATHAMDLFKELKYGAAASNAMSTAVDSLIAQGKTTEAQRFCKQAMMNFKKDQDKDGESGSIQVLVNLLMSRNDLDGALRAAKDGGRRLKELGDNKRIAALSMVGSQILLEQKFYDDAMVAARDAAYAFQEIKDEKGNLAAQQLMTKIYSEKGEEPPYSTAREEALAVLNDAKVALEKLDGFAYGDAMERLGSTCGVTKADVDSSVGDAMRRDPDASKKFFQNFGELVPKDAVKEGDKIVVTPLNVAEMLTQRIAYLQFRAGGLGYGPRYQLLRSGWGWGSGWDRQALATIRKYSDCEGWEYETRLYPPIYDAGLHTGSAQSKMSERFVNF